MEHNFCNIPVIFYPFLKQLGQVNENPFLMIVKIVIDANISSFFYFFDGLLTG
jgi:hypothetical protein